MKKITGKLLLCMIYITMVMALIPAVSFAQTEIASLSVWGISEPVPGETPDYEAFLENTLTATFNKAEDDGIVTINGIKWHSFNENAYISNTDTFCAGDNYYVSIALEVKDGYKVGSDTKCTINGKQAFCTGIAGTNKVYLTFHFEETQPFETLSNTVADIEAPTEGAYPDYTAELGNDECSVSEIRWYDTYDKKYLTDKEQFEGGRKYKLEIDLVPQENYAFATNSDGELIYTVQFNFGNSTYDAVVEGDKNTVCVSYNFDFVPMGKLNVLINEPVPRASPDFIAYTNYDACTVNCISWYDKTDDVYLEENGYDVFLEGHAYVVTVDVFAVGDAVFNVYDDFKGTVNGAFANVDSVVYWPEDGGAATIYQQHKAVRLSYEFEACTEETSLTLYYDNHTHQVNCGYSLPSSEIDNLEKFVYYITFYDNDGRLIQTILKQPQLLADAFVEEIPDNAKSCKVMIWNKTTFMPLCEASEINNFNENNK